LIKIPQKKVNCSSILYEKSIRLCLNKATRNTPTFCQWKGYNLTAKNRITLYVSKGFAHGFCALGENNVIAYKCDASYLHEYDSGVIWNDTELNVQ